MTSELGDRFWSKVFFDTNGSGCWLWTAAIKPAGYGHYRISDRSFYAHRLAFEELSGPIPEGLTLDHLCRTRACCNPAHLEPVTNAENIRRAPNRNREKTHCPSGHAYAGENLRVYRSADGREYRYCMTCCRLSAAASYLKKQGGQS